jgi:DNA-binding response OmpR family regulator
MCSISKPKILIIEDHPATLDAIKMIFEFEGYSVMDLSSTVDLHAQVASFQPDIILIDILLVINDGRSICTELKLSVHADIPILLMSSRNGFHNSSYYKPHWDDYIEKPFEMETITERVRILLSKKTQQT